uniref:Germ cell-specific gene 1-like protein n=1 Tax=Zosterops lateralis melanops TaxID=1220523 RepID=A0A8D2PP96_ZOSLA
LSSFWFFAQLTFPEADSRHRASAAFSLSFLSLVFSITAFSSSYWCEGTRKVAKPFCKGDTKGDLCIRFNSPEGNNSQAVQYIWETGDDKFVEKKFHAGIWYSCEEMINEDVLLVWFPGVLWLSIVAELLYVVLLLTGNILMSVEICYYSSVIDGLKINAFSAVVTVLAGLLGMVAHMMYTTVFQMTVNLGPEDWRPHTWDYGWSYGLAWTSFACCMAAAVTTINKYTKTILEFKHKRRKLERSFRIQYKFPDPTAPEKVCNVYVNSFRNTTDDPTHALRSLRHLATISVL